MDLLSRFAERAGHVACHAHDGQEAVEILQHASFDLMLLDLNMPRTSGVEVAQWLQDHPHVAPTMRVVVVTAWGRHSMGLPLQELGVETVMQKPLRMQQLNDLYAETLRRIESREPVK